VTRLTETDVSALTCELIAVEDRLREATGLGLRDLALKTVTDGSRCVQLHGARVASVPISTGEGVISGFSECVVATLLHLGCDAWTTAQPDVRGMQAAVAAGAEVLFLADDHRFVALNVTKGSSSDDDPATADGYVTALEAASGGLAGREVLVLGLGPVGRAAVRRLAARDAIVLVAEPDEERISAAQDVGLAFEVTTLAAGLARCDLIFDASPAADIIDAADVRPETIAAVPGMPSAFTAAAQEALGVRHMHEPLAVGVAVMAARALL
jgi:3-methylornithyl-N6-L-lysine dehydrogenase